MAQRSVTRRLPAGDVIARHHVEHGDFAFLEKPFSLPVLAQKVRDILDS